MLFTVLVVVSGFAHEVGIDSRQFAQQYMLRTWDIDNAFPFVAVTCMAQTPDGYLWVGSFSGLTRFNGIRFSPDHEVVTPEFRDVMVLELLADPDGVLWVGTNNGIFRRQGEKWRHYGDDEGVPKGLVAGLARDSHGRLFAMVGQKLLRLNGDRFEIWLPQPPDANNQKPWSLLVDADDQIWLMADRNLAYFTDESWHSFSPEEWGKGELVVQGFAAAKTGGIWVAVLCASVDGTTVNGCKPSSGRLTITRKQ